MSKGKPEHSSDVDHGKATESALKWLSGLATAVSAAGVILALLGYGVSLAAEAMFGISHSAIFNSAFELIDLGSIAILQILEITEYMLTHLFQYPLSIWTSSVILVGVVSFLLWKWTRLRKYSKATMEKAVRDVAARREAPKWAIAAAGYFAVVAMPQLFLALIGCLIFLAVGVLPFFGMEFGEMYLNEWVLRPTQCSPTRGREERLQIAPLQHVEGQQNRNSIRAVPCIAVVKEGKTLGRGRVVFSTSTAAVLFDPTSGSVRRVPTDGAAIDVLATL